MIKTKMTMDNGFLQFGISTKEEKTSIGDDGRIKFGEDKVDLHNYCEDLCREKCNFEPSYDIEDIPSCAECDDDCPVSGFYVFTFKLAMLENLIRDETSEDIGITKDEFKEFTKYKLKKFMDKHRLVFVMEDKGNISLFINKKSTLFAYNHRFEGWSWGKHRDWDIYMCNIPKDNKLIKTIVKFFKHRILF